MIPLKLTLQGIYSYREKQTIDFNRLTSAGLFGIFGQVGSGKSTILEAISFAVYGQTERLNQREERYYNMMNLKSDEMLIDFECYAGNKNSEKFRFIVRSKRSASNFNEVRIAGRDVYKAKGDDWIPVDDEPVEIIGLSYDNFRRTTIIPQGKFQEFLHLGDSDRTRMLREIFGLHKFELYHKTSQVERKYLDQKERITGQISQLGDLNEQEIENYQKQLDDVRSEIAKVNSELKEIQEKEKEFSSLKGIFEKLTTLKTREAQLKKHEEEFNSRKKFLEDYKYCRINFQSVIEKRNDLKKSIARELSAINVKREKANRLEKELAERRGNFAAIESSYNNREQLNRKVDELSLLSFIKDIETSLPGLAASITEFEDKTTILESKKRELLNSKVNISKEIEELKKSKPDVNLLTEIQAWYIKKDNLLKEKQKLENNFNEALQKLNDYDEEIENIIVGNPDLDSDEPMETGELLEKIVRKKGELKRELDTAQNEKNHLQVQNQLSDFTSTLENGKPCPLCGSTEHPQIATIEDVSAKLSELKLHISKIEEKIVLFDTARAEIEKIGYFKGETKKNLSDYEYSLQNFTEQLKVHEAEFDWDGFDSNNSEVVKEKISLHKKIEADILFLENNKEAIESNVSKIESELKNILEKKQEILTTKNSKLTELETLKKQIVSFETSAFDDFSSEELKHEQQKLKDKFQNIISEYNNLKNEIDISTGEFNSLTGELKALETSTFDRKTELEDLEQSLNSQVENSRFDKLELIEDILNTELNIDYEDVEIDEYFAEVREVGKNITSILEEIGDKTYDSETHDSMISRLQILDETKSELFQQRGNIGQLLDQFNRSLEAKRELEMQLEAISSKTDNIKVIKNMFKGSGFVNYVSTVYLRNLCAAANDRFRKLTLNRLSLELNESNNFIIRDFLNDGQVRSVKTLSGGQTFQAALSLALALSDSIQITVGSEQNFFFLDEGFGTLDKDSLSMVFDTLKALRKENRVVGVISHVEEMQEEIEASINVVNDPERGSIFSMK